MDPDGGGRIPSTSVLLGFVWKLPLPMYADVWLHIPMTHHNDIQAVGHEWGWKQLMLGDPLLNGTLC